MMKQIKFKKLAKVVSFNLKTNEVSDGQHTNRPPRRYLFTFPPETHIGEHIVGTVSNMRMKRNFNTFGSEWMI
jgi:hypothetical protein